jgi:hypothetical protein
MRGKISATIFIFSLMLAGGCKKQLNDQVAIRESIEKDINGRSRLTTSLMTHEVKEITIDRDQAKARVEFRMKQDGATTEVDYVLQQRGGKWTILESRPAADDTSQPR